MQRQLRRADEVGAAGSGVHVVEERGPEIKFAKTLVSNGEVVRVEWSGMAQVSQLDFIALYDKPDAENHDFRAETQRLMDIIINSLSRICFCGLTQLILSLD